MATSFVVNLADLAKILEHIRIAEQHAAGGNLADIIGMDSALLPFGLRTVDGSFNHLLPGQERLAAADELFPRLLEPTYSNDADGDTMYLGPGAPVITNTNYAATGPTGKFISVADADPRIISNLIVDQTVTNKAALVTALFQVGSTNPYGDADTIMAAADVLRAAQAAVAPELAQAAAALAALNAAEQALADAIAAVPVIAETVAAYDAALAASAAAVAASATVDTTTSTLLAALQAGAPGVQNPGDTTALNAAKAAVATLLASANAVAAALDVADPDVAALVVNADLVAAQDFAAGVLEVQTALNAINLLDNVAGSLDLQRALNAAGLGDVFPNVASELNTQLEASRDAVIASEPDVADALQAVVDAQALYDVEGPEGDAAQAMLDLARSEFAGVIDDSGLHISEDGSITIEHRSADIGLSPANSGWMTLFGQFFDHGLDLVTKGGNGTVYIPLQADDPLIAGADHIFGNADDLPAHLRFMAVTRTTMFDAQGNTQNTTTPYVDQNQTYTSVASHQVFLREYTTVDGKTVATGHLLDNPDGSIADWTHVKAHALQFLGIKFTDFDVGNVPLLLTDPYGKFIPDENGYAQVVTAVDADGVPMEWVSGTPADPVDLATTAFIGTGHAFLNDIAHHAAPGTVDHDHNPQTAKIKQVADSDPGVGDDGLAHTYDDEMLGAPVKASKKSIVINGLIPHSHA